MSNEMASNGRGGVQRVLAKLRKSVEEGNYYEAHQMYRTLYFRYMAQKKHAEAIELLYSGASLLLEHNQDVSGADLCLLLVEAFKTADAPISGTNIQIIANLFRMVQPDVPERSKFMMSALQWSKNESSEIKTGNPELHQKIAKILWEARSDIRTSIESQTTVNQDVLDKVQKQVNQQDGEGCASMLIEFHVKSGYPGEVDMFLAQAVLQYLCLKNKATATVTFHVYTEKHPAIETGPPFILPLLNFLWFLLSTIDTGKLTTFTELCDKYQPTLKRDPAYAEYLDKIGQHFFGLPPPEPTGPGGMLGNLFKNLFKSEEDADDTNTTRRPRRTSELTPKEEDLD